MLHHAVQHETTDMAANDRINQRFRTLAMVAVAMALVLAPCLALNASSNDDGSKPSLVPCPLDRGPVTTNVLLRVFPLRIGSDGGTAFTMEIGQKQYIVTAKHILAGDVPAEIDIQLDEWIMVPVNLVGMGSDEQDVLVLTTNRKISAIFPLDEGTDGLMLGQAVRFLGYFPSVQTSPSSGIHEKRCAVSNERHRERFSLRR